MLDPKRPGPQEYVGTYFVQNMQNAKELIRLDIQDRMLTAAMGGALPEQTNPNAFKRILDIGCGTGGWLIEAAQAYPQLSLVGVDIKQNMVDYARQQAETHQLTHRVEFYTMDALLTLALPSHAFDLVNLRLCGSFVRTWDWRKLLYQIQRVTRRDGTLRIIEAETIHQTNSPALRQLSERLQSAFFRAGHFFADEPTGLCAHIPQLLTQHNYQQIQTQAYAIDFYAGTAALQALYEDATIGLQNLRPFLQKWGGITKDLDYPTLCQQVLHEMQQPDFYATWNFLTTWARTPPQ